MATYLKEATFSGSNGSHFYIQLYYDISQNTNTNQSTLTYYLYVGSRDNYSGSGSAGNGYINGNWVGSLSSVGKNSFNYIGSRQETVNHNADGTGTANYNASFSFPWSNLKDASLSGSITLPTIPRASSVTATDANVESATSINISRASTSFKHTLTYSFEGLTGTIAENVATSYGWTIPTSFYNKLTNKKNATCTITCKTYNGSTLIGSKTTTFKVSVNEETNKPTVGATIIDSNSTTVALTGSSSKLVKYFSNAQVTMSATAKNGASIVSKSIVCGDGKSLTDSGTINNVESGTFVITATDSRGISNSTTITLDMKDYINLSVNANFYRTQPTNNTIALEYNGNYFNQSFGSQNNTLGLKYRYKLSTSSTWSSYTNLTPTKSGNTYSNGSSALVLGTIFDYTKEYDFELVASDKLQTITYATKVTQGIPVFDWGKEDFQFNVPVKLASGNEILDYTVVDEW